MKAGLRLVATAVALATTGCHDLTDTKRWSSMRWDDKSVDDVQASLYVAPAPATTDTGASNPVSAWSDRAQGALVAALAAKTKSAQDFKDSIIKAKPDGGMATVDNRNFLLVVTLSRPAGYVPGDRIARVDLRVSPINFSFGGYTIVQTARQTYSVTALTRTAGLEEDLSAGTPAGTPVTVTAGIKATQGSSTVTPITESAETLTVNMIPSCMRMIQEGAHSLDLTGNVKIASSLLTETVPIPSECRLTTVEPGITPKGTGTAALFVVGSGLTFKNGKPNLKAEASVGGLRGYPSMPLAAKVDLNYVLRRVDTGAESYDESVQGVTLRRGSNVTCQVIVPLSQLIPPLYALYGSSIGAVDGDTVSANGTTLTFTSFETATAAANWLTSTHATMLGSVKLGHLNKLITAKRFEIIPSGDPCNKQPFVDTEKARVASLMGLSR